MPWKRPGNGGKKKKTIEDGRFSLVGMPRWPPLPGTPRGRAADAWQHLQSDDHRWISDFYAAAVGQFADRVDEAANARRRGPQPNLKVALVWVRVARS